MSQTSIELELNLDSVLPNCEEGCKVLCLLQYSDSSFFCVNRWVKQPLSLWFGQKVKSVGNLDHFHVLQFLAHVTKERQRKWTRRDSGGSVHWRQRGGGSPGPATKFQLRTMEQVMPKFFNGEIEFIDEVSQALLGEEMSFEKQKEELILPDAFRRMKTNYSC